MLLHMAQDETTEDTNDDPTLVKLLVRRHVRCWWCQKFGDQNRTFTKRLTPLLRTADGRRHTKETIMAELEEEGETWRRTAKYLHPKQCKDEATEEMLQAIDRLDGEAERWRQVEFKLVERADDPAVRQLMADIGLAIEDQPVSV